MIITAKQALVLTSLLCTLVSYLPGTEQKASTRPEYTAANELKLPARYREWIYLTSGLDMSYQPGAEPTHHMFSSVFVNPEAYTAFLKTGTWPDQTTLVLEFRAAANKGSINKRGLYQSGDVMDRELHVKDAAHGGWSFYSFDDDGKPAARHPQTDDCSTCHAAHAAVDKTFVQFYPTLLPVAQQKNTLSPAYLKESPSAPIN